MLANEIFDMVGRANFEVLHEDVYEQGVVTEVRFIREDWVNKAVHHSRLQRLIQRGDISIG